MILAVENDHAACVGWLLARKVDINEKDLQGDTPLHTAINKANFIITFILLENGADHTARNAARQTPEAGIEAAFKKMKDEDDIYCLHVFSETKIIR